MKSSVNSPVIAVAAMLAALTACASGERVARSAMQDDMSSSPSSNASTATPGTTYNSTGAMPTASASATPQSWSGVVTAVDPILRQDAAAMGVGMAGAAAAGGVLANEGSPNDKVYRITMRADDGSTQVVVVDSIPTYKTGDRVRYRNGNVQRE